MTAPKMVTVRHPIFEGVSRTVKASTLKGWLDQGWIEAAPAAAPEATPRQTARKKAENSG